MLFNRNIITGLVLVISIFIGTGSAFARNSLRLIMEKRVNAQIPVSSVCPSIPKEFIIERIKGDLNFADKKLLDKQTVKNGLIPKFSLKEIYAEGIYKVTSPINRKHHCRFIVNFALSKIDNKNLAKLEGRGSKLFSSGNGWFVLEQTSRSARGDLTILYEDNQKVLRLNSPCDGRFYDPSGYTNWSYGIVHWNRDNPTQNGYSIKGEKKDSEWVRDLRCPAGPYDLEYRVDGVYNILWSLTHGDALKVPDHCTAKLIINRSTNKRYFSCCCNSIARGAALIAGKATSCSWYDPRGKDQWPNTASDRCGK
jgi:hypothetical protein